MEGWPEGWSCLEGVGSKRFVGPEGRYVLYGKRAGCRRAAWAIEGGPTIDREKLAKALHDAFNAAGRGGSVWGERSADTRKGYLAEADEAIRLLGGAEARKERIFARPSCGPQDRCDEDGCCITHGQDLIEVAHEGAAYAVKEACDQLSADHDAALARIEELERRNAALTATANAALERAKEAEDWAEEMRTLHTSDLAAALEHTDGAHFGELVVIAGQRSAMLKERDQRIAALTATANAAVARAEEAQLQAQRDEQDSETIALRAEVQRLRRALDRTAQGAAYLTDALSELTGGDHA